MRVDIGRRCTDGKVGMTKIGKTLLVIAAAFVLVGTGGALPAVAQGKTDHASYLTPFPPGDTHQAIVIGDWLAQGLMVGLKATLAGNRRINIQPRHLALRGLLRGDWEESLENLKTELGQKKYTIAVLLLGTYDRVSIRRANGRLRVGSDGWKRIYNQRVQQVMTVLKTAKVGAYWVGLPVMRGEFRNRGVRIINQILRQQAYRNGIRYIDIYRLTASDEGEFSAYGPDVSGATRLLRYKDGIHFTKAGYAKIAHFIEGPIRRDLRSSKTERDIPLLGAIQEQKRINPLGVVPPSAASTSANQKGRKAGKKKKISARLAKTAPAEAADHSTLTLPDKKASLWRRSTKIKLLRPAISRSVLAVITRGQSQDKAMRVGLTISDELPNGLVVLRSLTPAVRSQTNSSRLPASQLPFFRALVKGEKLPSVAGRADDFRWPRDTYALPKNLVSKKTKPRIGRFAPRASRYPPIPLRRPNR